MRWLQLKSKIFFQKLIHNWPIKILAVAAALVLFLLNRISNLEERFFSVPVTLLVNEQYMPAAPYPHVVRVTLRGDARQHFPGS